MTDDGKQTIKRDGLVVELAVCGCGGWCIGCVIVCISLPWMRVRRRNKGSLLANDGNDDWLMR